jgi:cation diffusion facilitator family transporter
MQETGSHQHITGRHSEQDHDHGQGHSHVRGHAHEHDYGWHDDHDHDHDHEQRSGLLGRLRGAVPFLHGHSHGEANIDAAMESSERGIWALKVSLLGLGLTSAFQVVIFIASGSVGLLADTIHNASDALTAVPLWIAFALGRRNPTERYTYGYGRAEDIAGAVVVLMIAASALAAAYESAQRFIGPAAPTNLGWVAVAALVGFAGNEAVALFRVRVGNEIGSAALLADGQHARIDGLTSLAVLLGVVGVRLGFPLADPLVGIVITIAILFIVRDTALVIWHRVMDAVDPEIASAINRTASAVPGVEEVHEVRVRWLGHRLETELHITVDEDLPTKASHRIAEEVRHTLFHAQHRLAVVNVHVDPCGHSGEDAHTLTAHHAHPGSSRSVSNSSPL